MSERPLIGVSTSEVRRPQASHFAAQSEPPRPELALGFAYMEAIETAGGIPVILPPLHADRIDGLLDRLQGVCLSGGPDLHPSCYGGHEHPQLGPTEPELDRFEIALAQRALERSLPLLAICRGLQVLNVARGGTLLQHVPEHVGDEIRHRQPEPSAVATHGVRMLSSSKLARLLAREEAQVNSFHHQAVDRLGRGLRAVAWAPDGIIEGIEAPGAGFAVGVQWHAEGLTDHFEQQRLLRGFVRSAARYASPGVPARRAA